MDIKDDHPLSTKPPISQRTCNSFCLGGEIGCLSGVCPQNVASWINRRALAGKSRASNRRVLESREGPPDDPFGKGRRDKARCKVHLKKR